MKKPPEAPPHQPPEAGRAHPAGRQPRSSPAAFRKEDRLRRRREFQEAMARGKRLYTPHFGVCLAAGPGPGPRLGIVATRRLGKAVQRNRVKRLLREFFRRHRGELHTLDVIIMAKKGAPTLSYAQVQAELAKLLLGRSTTDRP